MKELTFRAFLEIMHGFTDKYWDTFLEYMDKEVLIRSLYPPNEDDLIEFMDEFEEELETGEVITLG